MMSEMKCVGNPARIGQCYKKVKQVKQAKHGMLWLVDRVTTKIVWLLAVQYVEFRTSVPYLLVVGLSASRVQ